MERIRYYEIKNLKPGDVVVIQQPSSGFSKIINPYLFETVVSVNGKTITTDKRKYSVTNGIEYGQSQGRYYYQIIGVDIDGATADNARFEASNQRVLRRNFVRNYDFSKLNDEQVEAVYGLLKLYDTKEAE